MYLILHGNTSNGIFSRLVEQVPKDTTKRDLDVSKPILADYLFYIPRVPGRGLERLRDTLGRNQGTTADSIRDPIIMNRKNPERDPVPHQDRDSLSALVS